MTRPGTQDNEQRFPEVLPNGKSLLFSARGGVTDDQVYVESLETHERTLLERGSAPHYLSTGHLVFVRAGTLFAVRFDGERLEATGAPVAVIEGVRQARSAQPLISYSDVGSLVYVSANTEPDSNALVWVDSGGVEQSTGVSGSPVRATAPRARRTARRDVDARQHREPVDARPGARNVEPADGRGQHVVPGVDAGWPAAHARCRQGRVLRHLLEARRRQRSGRAAAVGHRGRATRFHGRRTAGCLPTCS